MSARAPCRLCEQSTAFVVAQRLSVHAGGVGERAAPQSAGHALDRDLARSTTASRTAAYAGGTRISTTTWSGGSGTTVNVKNEQHSVSRVVRSRAYATRSAGPNR